MGEYATFNGRQIKIGTCESMYYLRADQRHLIQDYDFSNFLGEVRFRFPFPDEDNIEPGAFEDYDRGVKIPGWNLPTDWKGHYSVQFSAQPGYLLSVPCPESLSDKLRLFELGADESARAEHEIHIHKNGWNGGAKVTQLRWRDDHWSTVVACGSCDAAWRLETLEDARPVIEAFRTEADRTEWRRTDVVFPEGDDYPKVGSYTDSPTYGHESVHGETHRAFLLAMAARIEAGYEHPTAVAA